MSYKSILTVLTDERLAGPCLIRSAEIAAAHHAHLDVLCLGVDHSQPGYYYASANALILQEAVTRAADDAEVLEAAARETLGKTGIRWGCDIGVTQLGNVNRYVADHARFADLVVLPRPYGKDHGTELESAIEGALFDGKVPVLMLPENAAAPVAPAHITIAWNESAEALAAVRAALPLLQAAGKVSVVVIDPPVHVASRSDPGGLLSQFLARHGVKVEIDVLAKSLPRVTDVLLRYAADSATDMVVMGAYGHSRFREAILGGATRNMLEMAELPVFLAH